MKKNSYSSNLSARLAYSTFLGYFDFFRTMHRGFGFGDQNEADKSILNFAIKFDLVVTNTFYIKADEHLITFKNEANRSPVDYFLVRRTDRMLCRDCKVIPGESLEAQHRLLVLDVCIKGRCSIRKEPRNPTSGGTLKN